MLSESGKVVGVDADGLWVETLNASACGQCRVRSGCGQKLLASFGGQSTVVKALLQDSDNEIWKLGDEVIIGLHEQALVLGALRVYMLPLALMIVAVGIAHTLSLSESAQIIFGLAGLLLGGCLSSRIGGSFETDAPLSVNSSHPIVLRRA